MRFIYVSHMNNVDVVYTKDFGITIVVIVIVVMIIVTPKYHNVAVRRLWIYNVLRPANIISRIIEFCDVMVIKPVPLEQNGVALSVQTS
jgi:hypothetical protein